MDKLEFFSDNIATRYGQKLQRISIDLALGCPNRLNRYGAGCTFCAEDGSRARHLARNLNLKEQVEAGVKYSKSRYNCQGPYIAYFQAFTSTYAPVDELRKLYEEVLSYADFKVIIIGTRPDALEPEKIEYLKELAQKYELWVELGVQSVHNRTLKRINRGHDFEAVAKCVQELSQAQIHTACHVILGLPEETFEDWMQSADTIAKLPFEAIKLHQLLIIKRTIIAKEFAENNIANCPKALNEYEYAYGAAAFLRRLPQSWQIMRISADADVDETIAPKWWMSKGEFLEFFKKYFATSMEQGSKSELLGVKTADGTPTLYHPEFRQHFHSLAGASSEAEHKFIIPSQLAEKLSTQDIHILDIGFGLGGNAIAALGCAQECQNGHLYIDSLELDLRTLKAAKALYSEDSLESSCLNALLHSGEYITRYCTIKLHLGDARKSIDKLGKYELIFMDGFSTESNPELWSYNFIKSLKKHLQPSGLILSYSSAYPFRGALLKLGFKVGESQPFGRKRGGTIAGSPLPSSAIDLPEKEYNIILKSTAGVPYRDPKLASTRQEILDRHHKTVSRLRKMGIPKWFKK